MLRRPQKNAHRPETRASSPGEGNGSPSGGSRGPRSLAGCSHGALATQSDADTSEARVPQGVEGRGRVPGRKCRAEVRPLPPACLAASVAAGAARVPGSAGGRGASAWFHSREALRVRQAYRDARAGGAFDPRALPRCPRSVLRSRLPRKCFPSAGERRTSGEPRASGARLRRLPLRGAPAARTGSVPGAALWPGAAEASRHGEWPGVQAGRGGRTWRPQRCRVTRPESADVWD